MQTSSVIKKRKDKADAAKKFLDSNKEEKALRTIYINNKDLRNVTVSPDERFVTYNLYQKNDQVKEKRQPWRVIEERQRILQFPRNDVVHAHRPVDGIDYRHQ